MNERMITGVWRKHKLQRDLYDISNRHVQTERCRYKDLVKNCPLLFHCKVIAYFMHSSVEKLFCDKMRSMVQNGLAMIPVHYVDAHNQTTSRHNHRQSVCVELFAEHC